MDVDDWVSQRNLFDAAMQAFGSIDVVCANVAIPEKENWLFEDKLDADGRLAEPDLKLIDVNLKGVMRSELWELTLVLLIYLTASRLQVGHALLQKELHTRWGHRNHRLCSIVSSSFF